MDQAILLNDASLYSLVISIIVGYAAPFAKDLVLASDAPAALKSLVTTVLAALAGVLPTLAWSGNWGNYVTAVLFALGAAVAGDYLGHSKAAQHATAGKGLGRPKQ